MTVNCWLLLTGPDVAVRVTAVAVGSVVDEDPPHPVKRLMPTTLTASRRIICRRRRFLKPNRQRATASVAPGNSGLELRWRLAVDEPVDIVSVVCASVVPVVVRDAGANEQVAPPGNPEHAKVTGAFNGFCGVTETVMVPVVCPFPKITNGGVRASVKFGGIEVML
jgi:hypothetical protein